MPQLFRKLRNYWNHGTWTSCRHRHTREGITYPAHGLPGRLSLRPPQVLTQCTDCGVFLACRNAEPRDLEDTYGA